MYIQYFCYLELWYTPLFVTYIFHGCNLFSFFPSFGPFSTLLVCYNVRIVSDFNMLFLYKLISCCLEHTLFKSNILLLAFMNIKLLEHHGLFCAKLRAHHIVCNRTLNAPIMKRWRAKVHTGQHAKWI